MTLPIGNALDLLSGHGGDNGETKSTWSNLTLTPAKLKLVATFIEQRGVKDGLELVGHHGKLWSSHPTLLCCTRPQGEWKKAESFSVEPGEIGLAPLEEAGDGIDQDAEGRLA